MDLLGLPSVLSSSGRIVCVLLSFEPHIGASREGRGSGDASVGLANDGMLVMADKCESTKDFD